MNEEGQQKQLQQQDNNNNKVSAIEGMLQLTRKLNLDEKATYDFMEKYLYEPARAIRKQKGGMSRDMDMEKAYEQAYDQFLRDLHASHKPLMIDLLEDIAAQSPVFAEVLERWQHGNMPATGEGHKLEIEEAYRKHESLQGKAAESSSNSSSSDGGAAADTNDIVDFR
jgi:hypothetical protein